MKKNEYFRITRWSIPAALTGIFCVLLVIPFFWYPRGYIDLTGDSYRTYYLDPWAFLHNYSLFGISPESTNPINPFYYLIPYLVCISLLNSFLRFDPWFLIAVTDGMRLGLSFISFYMLVGKLIQTISRNTDKVYANLISIVGGIIYISFITMWGWGASLLSFNHIFVYPLISYLFFTYLLDDDKRAGLLCLVLSYVFALNFDLTSAPQFFSFFPITISILLLYLIFVLKKNIDWYKLGGGIFLFVGLHAFHFLPQLMTLFIDSSYINQRLFDTENIKNSGVYFFEMNRLQFGKMSLNLFQSTTGYIEKLSIYVISLAPLFVFIKVRSKLLALFAAGFALTLFFVSANITYFGVNIYTKLFYLPGFLMFRSFYEKWYFVFGFYYAIVITISIYELLKDFQKHMRYIAIFLIVGLTIYRMVPFFLGKTVRMIHKDSRNVPTYFQMDPDAWRSLQYIKALPREGKILTTPLTYPSYQILYGTNSGAFVGMPMVSSLTGKSDFSGFWHFGPLEETVVEAISRQNTKHIIQLLSILNIRYIFHDNDERIFRDFPDYPIRYDSKGTLDPIKDQQGYANLLDSLPLNKLNSIGFYSIYQLDDAVVRPLIYVADEVFPVLSKSLDSGFRSAYVDNAQCRYLNCEHKRTENIPVVTYEKRSPINYDISIALNGTKEPFLIVFSNSFDSTWKLQFNRYNVSPMHTIANLYANAWIIDPKVFQEHPIIHGQIYLQYQYYFYIGAVISVTTFIYIFILFVKTYRYNEKKK